MADEKTPFRRRVAPTVPFVLSIEEPNGEKRTITFQIGFDMNAFSLVEEVTGLSMLTNIQHIWANPKISHVTAMMWAAIQETHPEFEGAEGLKNLRSIVGFSDVGDLLTALYKAFLLQLPKAKREEIEARAAAAEKEATNGDSKPPLV